MEASTASSSSSSSPSTKTRTLINSYINALSTLNFPLLTTHFAPTATWWINGNPQQIPYAGTFAPRDRIPQIEAFFAHFTTVTFTVHNLIVSEDGEKAVVEIEPRCEGGGPYGQKYRNDLVMFFKVDVEAGKIVEKREYVDHDEIRAAMAGLDGGEDGEDVEKRG